MKYFNIKKGHSVVSHRFPHRPVWGVRKSLARRRASSRILSRWCEALVVSRKQLNLLWTFMMTNYREDRAPLGAADEKIWQSFENLKEVVNNPRYWQIVGDYWWRMSTASRWKKKTLLPSRTHRRGALGQVIYTLVIFNYTLANTWISHPRMGVLFPPIT